MMSKTYYVKSEYEVPQGYIDIALLQRSGVEPKFEATLEVKYTYCVDSFNGLREKRPTINQIKLGFEYIFLY